MTSPVETLTTYDALRRLGQDRDAVAWGVLLERHGPSVFRVVRRILNDEILAADACQEAWLQIRALAGRFRPPGGDPGATESAARGWVLAVTVNVALHLLRTRRREQGRESALAWSRPVVSGAESEVRAMDRERADAVRAELGGLREAERLPILLRYYGGMDYAALAVALKCPVGTAKARVSRGLAKLRSRLAPLGLLVPLGELEAIFGGSEDHAEAERGAEAVPSSQERFAQWRGLLESRREPVLRGMVPGREVSLMTRLSCGVLAVLAACLVAWWTLSTRGAEGRGSNEKDRDPGNSGQQGQVANLEPAALAKAGVGEVQAPRQAGAGARAEVQPTQGPEKPVTDIERRALADRLNRFAIDFYGKLSGRPGNLFVSPYSVSMALAMTYAGARENTAREMEKVLRLDPQDRRLHDVCGGLIADLNAETGPGGRPRGFQLAVANRLFGLQGYRFLPAFLALTRDRYGAPLEALDFKGDVEGARARINAWVEGRTKERIKDLIPAGALPPDTRLVLVNAIHFKGDWAHRFEEKATAAGAFHPSVGMAVQVQFMRQSHRFGYREIADRLQVLELPYAGGELSMLVLLPSQGFGLAGLEAALTPDNLAAWTARLETEDVEVRLPRFKMVWGTEDLREVLTAMGMGEAFSPRAARFQGVTEAEALYLGKVLHKTFVEVNEVGTVAAGATAVVELGEDLGPSHPKRFFAERPFLFAIRHNPSGAILFLGRMLDPTPW